MTRDSLRKAGGCWTVAAKNYDLLEFVYAFAKGLRSTNLPDLQVYAAQMESSYEARKNTPAAKKLVDDMLTLATHIIYYRIQTDPTFKNAFVKCYGRLKAFESEAKKSLEHIIDGDSPEIKDRIGCRFNILNKGEDAIRMADIITNDLIEFFCGFATPEKYEEFIDWIKKSPEIDDETRSKLFETLSYNFILTKSSSLRGSGDFNPEKHPTVVVPTKTHILEEYQYGIKNYVVTPKDNGYQSIHFVLRMPSYSKVCPGAYFEFQIRTNDMHNYAERNLASHSMYKEAQQAKYNDLGVPEVFELKPDDVNLLGFTIFEDGKWADEIGFRTAILFEEHQVNSSGIS